MNKRIGAILMIPFFLLTLYGCGARDFLSTLGFDTHDYEGEEVVETYDGDSEKAEELINMLEVLTVDTPRIAPFDGANEAMKTCRDAVLNYMLNREYAKYTGNIALMDQVKETYPQMQISAIIPADDFENFVYTYFGGKQKIKNITSTLFVYLEKVNAYITVAQPQENSIDYNIQKIEETQNTYRVYFTCSLHDEISPTYKALIIKREDGNCYFRYLIEYDGGI
ncbi:hypothetical protein IMSAG013_00864 [Clostridiales bacterium]|nr:hypothetical protein IMSAG013_00864 [Clostridiales bacterium]